AAAALMALAAALAGMAAVRLVGAGFLGRPRSPRGAAAEEAGAPALAGMAGLAAMSVLIGLFPGAVLRLVGPAERLLLRADLVDRAGAVLVAPQAGGPGYAALGIAILLGLALALVLAVTRRRMVAGQRRGPAWGCGFAPAPAWLPFGDPLTQYGAASFAQPLARTLGATLLGARTSLDMPEPGDPRPARLATIWHDPADTWLFRPVSRLRAAVSALADGMQFLTIRRTLTVMFLVLVVFLTVIAVLGQL
ncbi:MAG: hydrogenase 4 subunit B, partial [Rhodospirillales bacterium]|nr:hydrogenase 4 subunit B [Rhodospirillales bacterium]